jgi:hypothetical protein
MKIESSGDTDLCEINFRLGSTDMKFNCLFQRLPGTIRFGNEGIAYIEFKDTYEIDQLINLLQRFKNDNQLYFGQW